MFFDISTVSQCAMQVSDPFESLAKISLNVRGVFSINNLWRPSASRRINMIWISVVISLLLIFASAADARPASPVAGIPRSIRDQSRHLYVSNASGAANSAASSKSFNLETSTSIDTMSLSIFSPLDILRQNMLLEIQRKRIRHAKQRQMQSNKEFLERIGR